MSDKEKALGRIEEALAKLVARQDAICDELVSLRERVEAIAASPRSGAGAPDRDEVIRFLDQFRAGEALGEAATGAWLEVAKVECLRGGLRVVREREGMHARLLAERIRELGAEPSFELPPAIRDAAHAAVANPEPSDAEKVRDFVRQFGDADKALAPLFAMADRLDEDPETQSLLRTIAQDERSTIEFFREACELLS